MKRSLGISLYPDHSDPQKIVSISKQPISMDSAEFL